MGTKRGLKMTVLTKSQKDFFWKNGYLVVEDAIDPALLKQLKDDFNGWVEESRAHDKPYGEIIDGRARFDLEPGHNAEKPELRRVNAPIEVSEAYFKAMANSKVTDCVADLIGPNVKIHHTKINSKLPGGKTVVKWHQDFPFTPHSNDDIITALVMIDDVTEENGPLEIVAGTHKGDIYDIWQGEVFTGSVNDDLADECWAKSILCTGKAGTACLMHTRLLHGSTANNSPDPRTLFISVYTAEDAVPSAPNPVPTKYQGHIVRGVETGNIRSIPFEIKLPQKPSTASFFDQQAKHDHSGNY